MAKRKFYIVWNEAKSEGFITDEYNDAFETSTGRFGNPRTTVGEAFRECYDDLDILPLQTVELETDEADDGA